MKNGEMREPSRAGVQGGTGERNRNKRERDENKADAAAGATMAHRPAKTRADAQKASVASTPTKQNRD